MQDGRFVYTRTAQLSFTGDQYQRHGPVRSFISFCLKSLVAEINKIPGKNNLIYLADGSILGLDFTICDFQSKILHYAQKHRNKHHS